MNIIELFLHTDVITPVTENNQLIFVTNPEQESYIPLFTSVKQYEKWNVTYKTTLMTLPLLQILLQTSPSIQGAVVNPMDQNLIYGKAEILEAAKKEIPFTENEAVRIESLKKIPESVTEILKKESSVKKAYLVSMTREINNEQSYVFVLDAPDYDSHLCAHIADEIFKQRQKIKIDFLSIENELGQKIAATQKPIYVK